MTRTTSRSEAVGSKPLYAEAWRNSQRCLIPALYEVEPCREAGKNVWFPIGLTGPHAAAIGEEARGGDPRPEDHDEWLHPMNIEAARTMPRL